MSFIQHIRELPPKLIVLFLTAALCTVFVLHTALIWMSSTTPVISEQNVSTSTLSFDVDNIASRNIFSLGENNTGEVAVIAEPRASSSDEFVLQAIFESTQMSDSKAIISVAGTNGKHYKVGDNIDPGISIDSIESNRVVLDTPRGKEALVFRAPMLASVQAIQQPAAHLTQPDSGLDILAQAPASKMEAVKQRMAKLRERSRSQ